MNEASYHAKLAQLPEMSKNRCELLRSSDFLANLNTERFVNKQLFQPNLNKNDTVITHLLLTICIERIQPLFHSCHAFQDLSSKLELKMILYFYIISNQYIATFIKLYRSIWSTKNMDLTFSKKCSRANVSERERVYEVDHEKKCALHFLSKFCIRVLNKVLSNFHNFFSFQIFLIKVVNVSGK